MKRTFLFFAIISFVFILSGCHKVFVTKEKMPEYKTANDFEIKKADLSKKPLSEIKAVYSDFKGALTYKNTCEAIKKGVSFAKEKGFNSVFVRLNQYELYSEISGNSDGISQLLSALAEAKNEEISIYLDIDIFLLYDKSFSGEPTSLLPGISYEKNTLDPSSYNSLIVINHTFSKLSEAIKPSGYILSGLDYGSSEADDKKEVEISKLSKEEYRKKALLKAAGTVASAVRANDREAIICYDAKTPVKYADRDMLINEGIFDCVFGDISDSTLFEKNIPVIVSHTKGENIYGLSDEYLSVKDKKNYKGSVYNSISSLTGSFQLNALLMAYENKIDSETKNIELKISTPQNNITVEGENIVIQGECDNNFPLYMNGGEIKPTAKGYFAIDVKLKNGKNVLVFEHKNKKSELVINYYLRVIRDISPTNTIAAASENEVAFTVYARKGAKVSGVINKTAIAFKERDMSDYDNKDKIDDGFALFEGIYYTPSNNTGKPINLGCCTVTASYKGFVQSLKSGNITVEDMFGKRSDGKRYIMEVTADFAETFDNDMSMSVIDKALPTNVYLPKGTRDYAIGEVAYSDGKEDLSYYKLECGKRVYKKDVSIKLSEEKLEGSINSIKALNNGRFTDVVFDSSVKMPFTVDFNVPFANFNKAAGSFSFSCNYNASKIDFILHNVNTEGVIDFQPNSLFSGISSQKLSETSVKYTFTLARAGRFYGFTSLYNENGRLVLRFFNPTTYNPETDKFSEGFKILIDAGHGNQDPGALGFNYQLYPEKKLNLDVALFLRDILQKSGAEVIMTRTDDSVTSRAVVNELAKREDPNLLISVHHNSSTSSNPFGPEAYYFYPFNQGLASSVVSAINRPHFTGSARNYYMSVFNQRTHNGMKMLVECAFMSNLQDWEYAINNSRTFAEQIAQGIKNYYKG